MSVNGSLDQLAAGFVITFLVLLHFVRVQPYTNVRPLHVTLSRPKAASAEQVTVWVAMQMMVNHMQTVSLVVQEFTLLYGIVSFQKVESEVEASSSLATLVLLLHIMIFALPPIAVFYEEGYQVRRVIKKYCCCWLVVFVISDHFSGSGERVGPSLRGARWL